MKTRTAGRPSPGLDARPRIWVSSWPARCARRGGGRRPWRRARRGDAHHRLGPRRPGIARFSQLAGLARALLMAVVLFVPVGRYSMAIHLPFDLELYRITVALVVLMWVASLLVDSRVRPPAAPRSTRPLRSSWSRLLPPSPSTSAVWRLSRRQSSRPSRSSFLSSSSSTSSPASSRALPAFVVITKFIVSGVAFVAFFRSSSRERGSTSSITFGVVLPVPPVQRVDHLNPLGADSCGRVC